MQSARRGSLTGPVLKPANGPGLNEFPSCEESWVCTMSGLAWNFYLTSENYRGGRKARRLMVRRGSLAR